MSGKLHLRQAVIVEGKYDKIKLDSVIDAFILTTDGFRIYKDKERKALIRSLAASRGLVVLTDSDSAGFRLRGYLSGMIPKDQITHVYIPDIFGKERRKHSPSAEGKLGVEGIDAAVLREAFQRAGVLADSPPATTDPITRGDLYEDGLTGGPDSAILRRALYQQLGLPQRLSTTQALELLNHMLTKAQYQELIQQLTADRQ